MNIYLIVIPVVILLVLMMWYVGAYNTYVRNKQKVEEAWSGIDVQLKRRLDLIPNLINTVKGYAQHEKDLIEKVTEQRVKALQASSADGNIEQRMKAENMLSQSLKSVFAVAENYPDLKANTNFIELQKQLAETEDQISAARRIYNGNVTELNSTVSSFPTSIIAGIHGFHKAEFFQMNAEEAAQATKTPVVSF